MLKHIFFALGLVCFLAPAVSAQQQMQDVVYLKDGSIIRGMIIEQIPNVTIKIQTWDGSVFVCKMEDIAKITKEKPLKQREEINIEEEPNKSPEKKLFHPYAEERLSKLANEAKSMKRWGWWWTALGTPFLGSVVFGNNTTDRGERISVLAIGGSLVGAGTIERWRANHIMDTHDELMKKPAISPSDKEERERVASAALVELADTGRRSRMWRALGYTTVAATFFVKKPDGKNYWMGAAYGVTAFGELLSKSSEEEALQGYLKDKESGGMSFRFIPAASSAVLVYRF